MSDVVQLYKQAAVTYVGWESVILSITAAIASSKKKMRERERERVMLSLLLLLLLFSLSLSLRAPSLPQVYRVRQVQAVRRRSLQGRQDPRD